MEITIAVSDLAHAEWAKQYFPEDLPQEWRFDYYANEFSALLSNDETLAQQERSNFLLVLEVAEKSVPLPKTMGSLIIVKFTSKPIEICSKIELSTADIISQHDVSETVCILRMTANHIVENNELKILLMYIRSNYSQFDRVCLFLSHSMQNTEVIYTCKIINDLL